MIKITAALMALYGVAGLLINWLWVSSAFGLSWLAGSLFMLGNLVGLKWGWGLIFSKKSIALAVIVIIFKYVILGLFLWILLQVPVFSLTAFVGGLGSLIFAIFGAALYKAFWRPDAF